MKGNTENPEISVAGRIPITYNPSLPITSRKDEIVEAIRNHRVVIISGETGSGKTTQIPKFCLEAGRGRTGRIGCTQPRRIAAVTVSARLSEELEKAPHGAVGYKIRFRNTVQEDTIIKLMTDGILLAEAQKDRFLREYDTIIVDEAHERSLNIDFILGILRGLLSHRKDLKILITSATIDTEKFSKAFGNAPIIEVSGRMYPVTVRYISDAEKDGSDSDNFYIEMAVSAVDKILSSRDGGDILVFMPTEQDIRETCELVASRGHAGLVVLPLFARLSAKDQARVFRPTGHRKVIVATNVAETSITIPGIRYVVDTGLARISRYSPRNRTTSLPIASISKSSADQRMGRCGRVQNGTCLRLYTEDDFTARPRFTPPEILRANLAEVILRMLSLRLGDVESFAFIDKPATGSIRDGYNLLTELGAITARRRKGKLFYQLTPKGRLMARIPLDPRLSCMLIAARQEKCVSSVAIIASALSIPPPFERPQEKMKEADQAHKAFNDPYSDFATLLNVWRQFNPLTTGKKSMQRRKQFCRKNYLSFKRMREWQDIHLQIRGVLRENRFPLKDAPHETSRVMLPKGARSTPAVSGKDTFTETYAAIHKSILSGLLPNIAHRKEKNIFRATREKEVMVFPGSGLFNHAGEWIVAAEMVETSRLFARIIANIDSRWIEETGGSLCRYTYTDPHWERKREEVVASEQVSLFGLVISTDRKVSYGSIDPQEATRIFIESVLVEEDIRHKFDFMKRNRCLIEDIRDMENRLRCRDILISKNEMADLFYNRTGECYNIKKLKQIVRKKGGQGFLRLRREDLLNRQPNDTLWQHYPDKVKLGTDSFDCLYRFDPGEKEDGLTVKIPASTATSVDADALDWVVPGLFREKVTVLVKGLPKEYRKKLVPVAATVDVITREMPQTRSSLISALGDFIHRKFGVDIPASAWNTSILPDYLKTRVAITDEGGREVSSGRSKALLTAHGGDTPESAEMQNLRRKWDQTGLTCWGFGELPERIPMGPGTGKLRYAYPAIVPSACGKKVDLRLFASQAKVKPRHREGVEILYKIYFSKDLKFLKKTLSLADERAGWPDYLGGKKTLENQMFDQVVRNLFRKDIRSQAAFDQHAATARDAILLEGKALREAAVSVGQAYLVCRNILFSLEKGNVSNPIASRHLKALRDEMTRLVPNHFISLYAPRRMRDLGRYLKTIAVRAQKGIEDYPKYRQKMEAVIRYEEILKEMLKELSPRASQEKQTAVEALHWMIEEFKVSLFAQELKTAYPISQKRLEAKRKEIERLL